MINFLLAVAMHDLTIQWEANNVPHDVYRQMIAAMRDALDDDDWMRGTLNHWLVNDDYLLTDVFETYMNETNPGLEI